MNPCYTRLLFFGGALLLAAEPALWLARTWWQPAYGGHGLAVFALVTALALWSLSSPRIADNRYQGLALVLLATTALVRLASQLLAVNVLGALTLVIDVYSLGLLAGLGQRRRALSPGWLAVLFAFSLPLERIAQRTVGFALQQLSADGACALLGAGFAELRCEGVRILLAGRDVLVDLPCSGARGLLLLALLFTVLAAVYRPSFKRALSGMAITLTAALVVNVIRICVLAVGIAFPDQVGVSVMASPWHDAIGLAALALGALPVLWWASRVPVAIAGKSLPAPCFQRRGFKPQWGALGFAVIAAVIISLPAQPVDVARATAAPALPVVLGDIPRRVDALSDQERAYFTRYGGGAARAWYGGFGLLLVGTSAPLRHLHAPDECLSGLGHRVEYRGPHYARLPSAVYHSTDPEGREWRVSVTYVSERGEFAISVSEAAWRWLQAPGTTWTMVQRIAPWQTDASQLAAWDDALARALDLPPHHQLQELEL